MEVLLVVREPLVRDQVKVGLQQFAEVSITCGEGYSGVNELRQRRYDCVFLAVDPNDRESLRLLQHLRSFDKGTELVVITTERSSRDMASDKSRLDIAAFLHTPIDVTQFFRLVGRLRARCAEADARKSSSTLKTV